MNAMIYGKWLPETRVSNDLSRPCRSLFAILRPATSLEEAHQFRFREPA